MPLDIILFSGPPRQARLIGDTLSSMRPIFLELQALLVSKYMGVYGKKVDFVKFILEPILTSWNQFGQT